MSNNLAAKLRIGTQKAHTSAENVGFMKCFVKGVVDRNCFAKFLSNLYYVYTELEAAIESNKNHPVIGKMYFPELKRQASLEKDMEFYYGQDWRHLIKPSRATLNYLTRIRQLSAKAPELLLGHTYTRYMGDLSGGQMLQKVAQSVLNLSDYEGTSFYDFEQIPDKKTFKDNYRQALDALNVDDITADKIVAEANYAFDLNMQITGELDSSLMLAIGEGMFNNLTGSPNTGSTEVVAVQ